VKEKQFLMDTNKIIDKVSEMRRAAESIDGDMTDPKTLQKIRETSNLISLYSTDIIQGLLAIEKKYYGPLKKGGK
tara:strand:+ start:1706 stop:1930 length:225 start_codon:yes stop_codon:yes gene_type:complete